MNKQINGQNSGIKGLSGSERSGNDTLKNLPLLQSQPVDSKTRFPDALAPDIIRANQKDSYVEGVLTQQLETVLRRFKGSRFVQTYTSEISSLSNVLYLSLTSLVGSRTLGEEYCDLFYVTPQYGLPSWKARAGYVFSSGLLPLLSLKLASKIKRLWRVDEHQQDSSSTLGKLRYWLAIFVKEQLQYSSFQTLVSLHVAIFYIYGSYYQISKRIWGLRYAFGHRLEPNHSKGGYEILGVLILAQVLGKYFKKLLDFFSDEDEKEAIQAANLLGISESDIKDIDLSDPTVLTYIPEASRKCTLCLSYMTNPASSVCGHIFCWNCICEWCREKPECPLCRQACLEQNLLPIR